MYTTDHAHAPAEGVHQQACTTRGASPRPHHHGASTQAQVQVRTQLHESRVLCEQPHSTHALSGQGEGPGERRQRRCPQPPCARLQPRRESRVSWRVRKGLAIDTCGDRPAPTRVQTPRGWTHAPERGRRPRSQAPTDHWGSRRAATREQAGLHQGTWPKRAAGLCGRSCLYREQPSGLWLVRM